MTRSDTGAVVAVKVLIEKDEVLPVGIFRVPRVIAVTWASSLGIAEKEQTQSTRELISYLFESHEGAAAGRTFNLE